ncbi:retrovirus-related pol polyprotein from transposon TNT 1-94 [Tanacetum coccineum]
MIPLTMKWSRRKIKRSSEIMEKKSVIARLNKVSSPDGDYLVIYRANGNFRAFNYLCFSEVTLDGFELILWGDLKIMMESSTEGNEQSDFWSGQQDWKIITWRLYESCGVCILEFEDGIVIHMLVERRYPLSKDLLQKLLDLVWKLKRKHKNWLLHKQTACGKDFSNPFMVDNLPKIVGFSTHLASVVKSWLVHDQTVHALASPKANGIWIRVLSGAKVVTSIMPGFGYGPCGQHKTSYREAPFPRKKCGKIMRQQGMLTADEEEKPTFSQKFQMQVDAMRALNEIKSTFRWRVVCAWIGNDPCGDGDLPAWSSITCSTQSDDSVISQLLLNARTPQQNGVAERKNRTLIEAARTMLADSFLPNTFWAEAVSTACYVLNRVLVTKPHNKTPYELLTGKIPIISYIRPFGCHVTILNTIDHLGKFAGKSDEGFLVGYSLQSKAFRVYNLETKRVEENLHINFLENKPNIAGKGPTWLFDLDYLTDSMNYHPVRSENQANHLAGQQEANQNAGTEDIIDAGDSETEDESAQDCFVLPIWPSYSSTITPDLKTDEKRDGPREEEQVFMDELERLKRQEKEANEEAESLRKNTPAKASSTNLLNTVSIPVSTASPHEGLSLADPTHSEEDDSEIPPLEDNYQILLFAIMGRRLSVQSGFIIIRRIKEELLSEIKQVYQMDVKVPFVYMRKIDEEAMLVPQLPGSMIGSLMYLTASRPDINVAVYLKGKPKLGLWYPRVSSFDLESYSDSDYAEQILQKSTPEFVNFLGRETHSLAMQKADHCGLFLLQNAVLKENSISCLKINTDDNVADLLTKAFDVSRGLIEFRELLSRVTNGTEALLIPTLFILWLDKVSTDSAKLVPLGEVCTALETLKKNTAKALISLLTTISLSNTMAVLDSCPKHNMVAYLEKSEGNAEFHEIIDFLKRSYIHHALTSVSISEASIRSDLLFDDADGIDSLPNQAIFDAIQLMGSKSTSWDQIPTNIATAVICLTSNQKYNFSKLIFDGCGVSSERPPKAQPTPLPWVPQNSIPETSGENLGGHSSSDKSLSGNEDDMTIQSVYDICPISMVNSVSLKAKIPKEELPQINIRCTKSLYPKQGRSLQKVNHPISKRSSNDEMPEDTLITWKQRNSKEGSQEKCGCKIRRIDENILSNSKMWDVEDTEEKNEGTEENFEGTEEQVESTDGHKKEEDESESESDGIPKAEKKFKQLESDEEMARKIQEEWEVIESRYDFLARTSRNKKESNLYEEMSKFLHDTIAAQRKFLAQQRSEAIRNRPPTKNQLRNQMMTYLKHVGNFKHAELKIKKFEEVQALYEKIKRSDEDFISIGSAEDERLIKKMNEKGVDSSKEEMIKDQSKEEVQKE